MKFFNCFSPVSVTALSLLALVGGVSLSVNAYAQTQAQTQSASSSSAASSVESMQSASSTSSTVTDVEADDDADSDSDSSWHNNRWRHVDRHRNELVGIGNDVTLRAGERAGSLVSILGAVSSEGEVVKDVVSVAGDARVTGPVGHDVVSVFGSLYINSAVGHDVVVTMGSVKLGPQAVINGHLVTTGSSVSRDPAAVIRNGVVGTSFGPKAGFAWLQPWIDNCLKYGRPLAFAAGLGWAWTLALLSLLTYFVTALMAPRMVDRCVTTLETSPGYSLLAALLSILAKPILFILLLITVIGIVAIPFLGIAVLSVGFFGKLVMLAWLGRRVARAVKSDAPTPAAIATLIGGVIVTALYLVPIVGFVVYKLLDFVGFGVVVYTLILVFKERRQQAGPHATSATNAAGSSAQSDAMYAEDIHTSAEAAASLDPGARAESASQSTVHNLASLPRATFWMRMGALLLDIALVAFVLNLVLHLNDVLLLAVAIYGALMWKLKGTTIGGILFDIRVVRLDGRELDWPTVVVRALSCFLSLIALGLGFIWMAFDPERQAWHDKIAGTVVVITPKGVSLV